MHISLSLLWSAGSLIVLSVQASKCDWKEPGWAERRLQLPLPRPPDFCISRRGSRYLGRSQGRRGLQVNFVNWHPKVCITLTEKPISRMRSPPIPDLPGVGGEGMRGGPGDSSLSVLSLELYPKEWDVVVFSFVCSFLILLYPEVKTQSHAMDSPVR